MIKVENLTKRYGELVAVNGVSFHVERGEILGFLGPNGAGKTTTMRIITGYISPTEGSVRIGEFDMADDPLSAKAIIGYLPENPPLYNEMTVEDYLDFVAEIKGVQKELKKDRVAYAMERCGIEDVSGRLIGNLSKGYRQRTGIAQALAHDPELLVLDEPTIGLDPLQIIEIRELIKSFAGERTVILSTHILQEVTMTCTRVIIINEGEIVLEESMSKLSQDTAHTAVVALKLRSSGAAVSEKLRSINGVDSVAEPQPGVFEVGVENGVDVAEQISKTAVESGWGLLEMRPVKMTLEDVFIKAISTEEE
ncbi:MAG: ATP-binding cassette domain-containing protein [Candidatus Dadabacteria bacterium]|nr:ATP-binding cassette domain-containing protein [Candidatus Dadabacteria bacterium]